MARPSTVRRQPGEVREAIGRWHREGWTLDEILDALDDAFGVKLSRSALHRHVKGLDKVLERIERSRQIAEAAVARFGQEPESKTARANIELMQAAIQEILDAEEDPETGRVLAKPMDAMLLAKALEHLTKASRHDAEYTEKIRAMAAKEAAEKMEKATRQALAESSGEALSPETAFTRIMAAYRGEG
jgi:2-succinyl-5-enolpyruvyl-6-hydroxy-3-cyclohexene-1-carboxylate synthase